MSTAWDDLAQPVDAPAHAAAQAGLLSGRLARLRHSMRCRCQDGGEAWADVSISCVRNPDQSVRFLVLQMIAIDAPAPQFSDDRAARCDIAERVGSTGSWRVDPTTGRLEWSRGMFALSDADPDEFDGDPDAVIRARVYPADLADLQERRDAVAAGHDTEPANLRIVHRDGSIHFLRGVSEVRRDPSGRPVAVFGAMRDVTALEQAEASLRASRARLQSILDTIPAIIAVYDLAERTVTFLNRRINDTLGYEAETIEKLGRDLAKLLSSEQRLASCARIERLLSLPRGETVEWEAPMHAARGDALWLRIRATIFDCDGAGAPTSLLVTARDITADHEARVALTHAADRLQATLDSQLDPHVLFTAVRDETGAIIDFVHADANRAACQYLGRPYEHLVGTPLTQLFPAVTQGPLLAKSSRLPSQPATHSSLTTTVTCRWECPATSTCVPSASKTRSPSATRGATSASATTRTRRCVTVSPSSTCCRRCQSFSRGG